MTATEGHRFDERVVASRDVRHAAETYAGVALMLLRDGAGRRRASSSCAS